MSNSKISENAELLTNAATESVKSNASEKSGVKMRPAKKPSTIWSVVGKARRKFDAQLTKTNDVKRTCLDNFIKAEFTDEEKFWSEYMDVANRLLDSKRFEKECGELGVAPRILATHIVFLGAGKVNEVLKKGIVATLNSDYILYKDKFTPDTADKYAMDYDAMEEAQKALPEHKK
ncbi:MAG: hypothetical protein OSJ55_06855 [Bacteroidales bacterium]|nr:hypothetical protein [Bacteroidales bacterium]